MLTIFNLIICISYLELEYITFAEVTVDHRGYRRLTYDGFRFGVKTYYKNGETNWRCTSKGDVNGRCRARIRTQVINGYEMIKDVNEQHNHQ